MQLILPSGRTMTLCQRDGKVTFVDGTRQVFTFSTKQDAQKYLSAFIKLNPKAASLTFQIAEGDLAQ